MNPNRVLLMQLSERTSGRGNRYLAGWLGKASVVAFQADEPDKFGNPVWEVFVAEPQPRADQRPLPLERAGADHSPVNGASDASVPAPHSTTTHAEHARHGQRPAGRGDGWRGPSVYRRGNGARRAPAADGGTFYDDSLEDIGGG